MGERTCAFDGCNSLEFRKTGYCLKHKDHESKQKSEKVLIDAGISVSIFDKIVGGKSEINPKIFLSIGLILILFSIIINPGPCKGNNFLICISPQNWYEQMSITICSMTIGIILLVIGTILQQGTEALAALFLSIVFLIIGFLSDGLGFLLSPISLILANKSLKITNASPSHRDRRIARAAQIISWVMFGPVLLGIALISIFVLIG